MKSKSVLCVMLFLALLMTCACTIHLVTIQHSPKTSTTQPDDMSFTEKLIEDLQ